MEKIMSRLIKKLNKIRQPEAQPMGFMSINASVEKSRMQVVASLNTEILEAAAEGLKSADAVLLDASTPVAIKAADKFCQASDDIPGGRWLKDTGEKAVKKALDGACDFIVFNSSAPTDITANEKIGRILELDINLSDGLLRSAGDLPVDAILIPAGKYGPFMTLQDLMNVHRLAAGPNKPVLVSISADISSDNLQALWNIGICGVVVEITDEKSSIVLSEIRQKIEKLGPPAFRKKTKASAILPQSHLEKAEPEEDEGEEEEDE
jgi:hypothetical protein